MPRAKKARAASSCAHRTPAWCALPASTAYGCKSKLLGRAVPGRNGGRIVSCATPSKSRPREGQWWIERDHGGGGNAMRKSTARDRMRAQSRACDRVRASRFDGVEFEGARLDALTDAHVPGPLEYAFPHRRGHGVGCFHHRIWTAQRSVVDELTRWLGYVPMGAELRGYLEQHPDWPLWIAAESKALDEWAVRIADRAPKATFSTARESARYRADAIAQGIDTTGAEYRDGMRGGEGARRRGKR